MTLSWIEAQIEETLGAENSAKNVYDLAMLCICRDEMERRVASESTIQQSVAQDGMRDRDAVRLTAYSADLDTVPTLEQIDDAIGSYAVNTVDDRERIRDMRTWRDIIKSGSKN